MFRTVGRQIFDTKNSYVPAATGNTQLLAADPTRVLASVLNDSTAIMTVIFSSKSDGSSANPGGDAALTAGRKTLYIAAGGYFETPVDYAGEVWAKWAAANGNAEITEYR